MSDPRITAARARLDAAIAEKREAQAALAAAMSADHETRMEAWERYERALLTVQAARADYGGR